jgi:hypothetical protein
MSGRELKDDAANTTTRDPASTSGKVRKGDYAIGYGRPPARTRFKPGQSGNPNGRPAGRPNVKTTMARVINERVAVREGQKSRTVTKLEAMLQAHTLKAIKGDTRSASIVIGLVTRMGLLGEPEEQMLAALPQEDQTIVSEFLRRNTGSAEPNVNGLGEE